MHGRNIISTFARLVDCLKDLRSVPNRALLYLILNIWSVQIVFTLKGMTICSLLLVQLNTVQKFSVEKKPAMMSGSCVTALCC